MDFSTLSQLKDALESAQKNTHRMIHKLEGFETRLIELDRKMRPVQEETQRYTAAKDNISKTLMEVGKTYEYFRVASEVKDVINCGFAANQKAYLEALIKLSNAKFFFQAHREIKSSTTVLVNIESLLVDAQTSCLSEFEKLLNTAEKTVILVDGQYQTVNPLTQNVAKDIRMLCDAFDSSNSREYYKIYQSSRVSKLKQILKEFEKSQSVLWHSLCYTEDPFQKGTNHIFQDYFHLSYWLLRSEYSFMGNILPLNEESLSCFIHVCDSVLQEIRNLLAPLLSSEQIHNSSMGSAVIGNLDKNKLNTVHINPVIRQSKLLLIRLDLFDIINNKYDDFRDVCHPDARHESSASLGLNQLRQQVIDSILKSLEYLLSSAIGDAFQDQINRKSSDITDCDLHPATNNLIFALKECTPSYNYLYKKIYDLAMLYHQQQLPVNNGVMIPNDMEMIVCCLLENLVVALEARAEQFQEISNKLSNRVLNIQKSGLFRVEDKSADYLILTARKHLFLINNVHPVCLFLKEKLKDFDVDNATIASSSSFANTAMRKGPNGNATQRLVSLYSKTESRMLSEQTLFCERIALAVGLHSKDMQSFSLMYEGQKSQQARILKAKFNVFNTGFDALLSQQGEWRLSSAVLRELLTAQLIQTILPIYGSFFNSYSPVKFSKKHMNEYLKYTPAKVETHLQGFFGRVAVGVLTVGSNISSNVDVRENEISTFSTTIK